MTDPVKESSVVREFTPQPIVVTENAARKVWSLLCEEEAPQLLLRIYISGGGCSGFQYGFTFDDKVEEGETVIVSEFTDNEGKSIQVRVVVDPMSLQYLVGATVDYKEDLNGSQFIIKNPNAATTCGCGSSFGI